MPLSLLAFVATVNSLSCSSKIDFKAYKNENGDRLSQIPNVHHMFRRHVGLKKQHEIQQLGVVEMILLFDFCLLLNFAFF